MALGWVIVAALEWAAWRASRTTAADCRRATTCRGSACRRRGRSSRCRAGYPEAQREEAPTWIASAALRSEMLGEWPVAPAARERGARARSGRGGGGGTTGGLAPSFRRRRSGTTPSTPSRRTEPNAQRRRSEPGRPTPDAGGPARARRSCSCGRCRWSRATASTRSPSRRRDAGSVAAARLQHGRRSRCRHGPSGCARFPAARRLTIDRGASIRPQETEARDARARSGCARPACGRCRARRRPATDPRPDDGARSPKAPTARSPAPAARRLRAAHRLRRRPARRTRSGSRTRRCRAARASSSPTTATTVLTQVVDRGPYVAGAPVRPHRRARAPARAARPEADHVVLRAEPADRGYCQ